MKVSIISRKLATESSFDYYYQTVKKGRVYPKLILLNGKKAILTTNISKPNPFYT